MVPRKAVWGRKLAGSDGILVVFGSMCARGSLFCCFRASALKRAGKGVIKRLTAVELWNVLRRRAARRHGSSTMSRDVKEMGHYFSHHLASARPTFKGALQDIY